MTQQQIDRINELARKAKADGLTPEEAAERAGLREAYRASIRGSLASHLANTYVVDEHGNKRKLSKRGE